jgi:predicted transcriptional regulator
MEIIRAPRPDNGYLQVRNEVARDQRISRSARGLLMELLSHSSGYRTDAESLAEIGIEGVGAIYKMIKELKDAGYIEQRKSQNEKGHWTTSTYVYDTPDRQGAAEDKKPVAKAVKDPYLTTASHIVSRIWEPLTAGKTAQPAVAVVRMVANALRNGITEKAIETALTTIANRNQTVTVTGLNTALNGAPVKGQLAADKKTDWSAIKTNDNGETPF